MEFKIIMDIDKIKVYSPYNPEFVRRIKHMKGKWRDGCWEVRADLIEEVRALMVEIYGRDDRPTKMVNIKVTAKEALTSDYCSGIEMFGRSICRAYGRDSGAKISDGIVFLKGDCTSDGSMKNWYTKIFEGSVFIVYDVPVLALEFENPYANDIKIEVMEKKESINKADLMKEKEQLLKRIAEIDELLQKGE